jgi:hypothetical protein
MIPMSISLLFGNRSEMRPPSGITDAQCAAIVPDSEGSVQFSGEFIRLDRRLAALLPAGKLDRPFRIRNNWRASRVCDAGKAAALEQGGREQEGNSWQSSSG